MKMIKISVVTSAALVFGLSLVLSAPFQNLSFEEGQRNPEWAGGTGPISELLPNWSLRLGMETLTHIGYNFPGIFLQDSASISDAGSAIDGRTGVYFFDGPSGMQYSLTQVGEIPTGSQYIEYSYFETPFRVTVDGEFITPPWPFHQKAHERWQTVRVDISQFAGQTVELGFRTQEGTFPFSADTYGIDAISFVVPEPSTLALGLVAGGLFAGIHLWRGRSKR